MRWTCKGGDWCFVIAWIKQILEPFQLENDLAFYASTFLIGDSYREKKSILVGTEPERSNHSHIVLDRGEPS